MTTEMMTATWAGGMRFVYKSASGHGLLTDATVAGGGEGTAVSPMELIILGLIGCTGVDVASILERMREPLLGLEVTATYERAEKHPKVYTKIHLTYSLRGSGFDEKKVRRAIDLSENKYCSVSAMLGHTAEITNEYTIES
ncbi:MAG: OsmC family protein [Candidatus Krumholzibacteria bacterium]|nr:OsmC family protein [Candidatus Krumholzibacteria bacterium]